MHVEYYENKGSNFKIDYTQLLKPASITNPRNKFVCNIKPQYNKKIIDIDLYQLGKEDKKDKNVKDFKLKVNNLNSNFSIISGSSIKSGKIDDEYKLDLNKELQCKRSQSSENLKDYIGSMIRKKSNRKNLSGKELKECSLPKISVSTKSSFVGSILKSDQDKLENVK